MIYELKPKEVLFEELQVGDPFAYGTRLYVKVEEVWIRDTSTSHVKEFRNAVDLAAGMLSNFPENQRVIPVRGKFVEE